jgi:hypothetical protein
MNKRKPLFVIAIIITGILGINAIEELAGPQPGHTGAPGEFTCAYCHSGNPITSGNVWDNISFYSDIPALGYNKDSTYNITISIRQNGKSSFGFQLTTLTKYTSAMAGTLVLSDPTRTKLTTNSTRYYVSHTNGSTAWNDSNSWSFQWTAPSTNTGPVKFYAALVTGNNNSAQSGDTVYTKSWTINQGTLNPTAEIQLSENRVCVGDTVFFSGSGLNSPTQFEWLLYGGTPSSSNSKNGYVVYESPGNNNIRLVTRNSFGASSPTVATVSVLKTPSAELITNKPPFICGADSVKISADAGNNTYKWNIGLTSEEIYVKDSGAYFVEIQNQNGCKVFSDTLRIGIGSIPLVNLFSNNNSDTVCKKQVVEFVATNGLAYYLFYNDTILKKSDSSNIYLTNDLKSDEDIFAIGYNHEGCFDTSNRISFEVFDILETPSLNSGKITTNSIEVNWGSVLGAVGYEISSDSGKSWTFYDTNSIFSHTVIDLPFQQKIEILMRAVSDGYCRYSDTAKLVTSTLPCSEIKYKLVFDSVICENEHVRIELNDLDISSFSVSIDSHAFTKDSIFILHPKQNKVFNILVIDSNSLNCPPLKLQVPVQVKQMPDISLATMSGKREFCENDSLILLSVYSDSVSDYSFYRNSDLIYSGDFDTLLISNPDHKDVFYLRYLIQNGCIGVTEDIIIDVFPNPVVSLVSNKDEQTFCEGDTLTFEATSGFSKYHFFKNSVLDTIVLNNLLNILNIEKPSLFFVKAESDKGCFGYSDTLLATMNKLPNIGFYYQNIYLDYWFKDTTRNVVNRLWDFGDGATSTQKNQTHLYDQEGEYIVELWVEDSNQCSVSDTQMILAKANSIYDNENKNNLDVYYNQASKSLMLKTNFNNNETVSFELYSMKGVLIKSEKNIAVKKGEQLYKFDVSDVSNGFYVSMVSLRSKKVSKKLRIF